MSTNKNMNRGGFGQTTPRREAGDVQGDESHPGRAGLSYTPVIDLTKVPTRRRNPKRARVAVDLNQNAVVGNIELSERNEANGKLRSNEKGSTSSGRRLSTEELAKSIHEALGQVDTSVQQLITLARIGETVSMNKANMSGFDFGYGRRITELEEQLVAERKLKDDLQRELDSSKEICRLRDQTICELEKNLTEEQERRNVLEKSRCWYLNELNSIKKMIDDGELFRVENEQNQGDFPEAENMRV